VSETIRAEKVVFAPASLVTVHLPVLLTYATSADARVGRANIAALTAASASSINFLFMSPFFSGQEPAVTPSACAATYNPKWVEQSLDSVHGIPFGH
jgi:hypothetical protein